MSLSLVLQVLKPCDFNFDICFKSKNLQDQFENQVLFSIYS
jgi:hypothetical protein